MNATVFEAHRDRLFGVAYRMLGTVADAEDVVQDAFVRWAGVDAAAVNNPGGYLTTIVTRLCVDRLRAARHQREQYVGPWLPEPLLTTDQTPADDAELADSLSMAFLMLLETLSPTERAVFLLHDVFDYGYADIAETVGKSEANCRQIARRARQHVQAQRVRFEPTAPDHARLLQQFMDACYEGNLQALVAVLADDITLYSDGGGKAIAARKPVEGAAKVANFFLSIVPKAPPGTTVQPVQVNGQAGLAVYVDGQPDALFAFHIVEGHIQRIFSVRNPDKLGSLRSRE